LYDGWENI
jgi:hypothetical protein